MPPIVTTPAESATLVAAVFMVTQILKKMLDLKGRSVQAVALLIGIAIAFGDVKPTIATAPWGVDLIWASLLRGLILSATAMGVHSVGPAGGSGSSTDGGDLADTPAAPLSRRPPDLPPDLPPPRVGPVSDETPTPAPSTSAAGFSLPVPNGPTITTPAPKNRSTQ